MRITIFEELKEHILTDMPLKIRVDILLVPFAFIDDISYFNWKT